MLDWWLDVPFEKLRSLGIGFVCLASVTSSPDSVQSFLNWVTALQDRVRYVVFRNLKDGDYLPDYDESDGALGFRQRFAPHPVVIPRLDEEYVTELERLNLTIAEVLDSSSGMSARGTTIGPVLFRLMVRARLRRFQQGIYDQLDAHSPTSRRSKVRNSHGQEQYNLHRVADLPGQAPETPD